MAFAVKKIGVLGTGDVGKALATGFLSLGCEVKMGSRDPQHAGALAWAKQNGARASVGSFADAAQFGELLVLAVLGSAVESVIEQAGRSHFTGKIVLDPTNPLTFTPGQPPQLFVGHTDSLGERVQRILPAAKVVKVYNTVGSAHMVRPTFAGGPPDMFLCGNDASAKAQAAAICQDFGWNAADMGDIQAARLLEPLCLVWVTYALRTGGWNHAFKMLKK